MYISITSIKLPKKSFQIFIWKSFSRKFSFERKLKSKMEWNSEPLLELATLETNANGERNIFADTAKIQVCEFNNFNIGTVNAIQKKFV